jgi:hypothetical protein
MGHLGGSASAEIDAPLEDAWAVIKDVISSPEWQGGLDKMTALERDAHGRPTLVETEMTSRSGGSSLVSGSGMTGRSGFPSRRRRAT